MHTACSQPRSYNGGLFKYDLLLDEKLHVPDLICTQLKQLTRFDFDTEVSVNILGHIFEQSVTDLEELKSIAAGEVYDQKTGKRKKEGVFYTPAFITQYIVGVGLGGYLRRKEQELRNHFQLEQIPDRSTNIKRETEIKFWEAYRDDVLLKTRVIDPACGSGAFLIAAFDYLNREYERVNEALAALEYARQTKGKGSSGILGQRSLFDLNKTILNENLYGVDLSPEAVEITKLSLWLKTAEQGKALTYLDDNIKVGNSIISDQGVAIHAFNWEAEFSEVFLDGLDGGFDVVIGNPPYVRQSFLSPYKTYLQENYDSYDGYADLYTYFYEKGLRILKQDGILSYIVTNKWLRARYGEPLRRFFSQTSIVEQIIDFGHAPIFKEADTFPCIVVARKFQSPIAKESVQSENLDRINSSVLICPVSREKLNNINLPQYVQQEGYQVPWSQFGSDAWSIEKPEVEILYQKIRQNGIPLNELLNTKPFWGIITGFNDAFLIDEETKNKLIREDSRASEIIKPYLRGQDVKRWVSQWQQLWMLFVKWDCPIQEYPSVLSWLEKHRRSLENRPEVKQGKLPWYVLSRYGANYWQEFEKPKLIYQEIQFHPSYSYDDQGYFTNNKVFIIPNADLYVLAVLNSPLLWWHNWRYLPHMKDEALNPAGMLMEILPIAPPTNAIRAEVEPIVNRLIEITKTNQKAYEDVLYWLQVEQSIDKPGKKLESFDNLEQENFIQQIKLRKTKKPKSLSPKIIK